MGELKEINREGTCVSVCVCNGVSVILSAALCFLKPSGRRFDLVP